MLTIAPTTHSPHAMYVRGLESALAALEYRYTLPGVPWALFGLNAAFYLREYLRASAYQAALTTAAEALRAEQQVWPGERHGTSSDEDELQRLIGAGTSRPMLYRWLFEQAHDAAQPARLLLAQHAVEMAEVLDDALLLRALRVGLLALPDESACSSMPSTTLDAATEDEAIEQLCHAFLTGRIKRAPFADGLLMLHAARRAREMTNSDSSPLLKIALRLIGPLPPLDRAPKRLSITQPFQLAQRALALGPRSVVLTEAGLVEIQAARGAQALLLLAALDRALR